MQLIFINNNDNLCMKNEYKQMQSEFKLGIPNIFVFNNPSYSLDIVFYIIVFVTVIEKLVSYTNT